MNIKRTLAQSYLGQQIRRIVHNRNSNKTLESAVDFLNKWGGDFNIPEIAKDMYEFCKKFNYSYTEYMFYHFYDRGIDERLTFISSEERIYCCEKLNKADNWDVFENKANTYLAYEPYFKRDVCIVRNPSNQSERETLKRFIKKHPCFMAKTLDDAGGVGITKYDVSDIYISDEWCDEFLAKYSKGCLCEELIIQSEEFSRFHPESVNTLRITTIRFDDHVEIVHPAMRVGTGKSYVDNAGSNGILCAIDSATGKVIATANERGEAYTIHPDTGVELIGCQIPYFEEALELAKELAQVIPTNRYTGWDLAHTTNGWVLVEANSYGGFVIWQIPLQKGFREEWNDIMNRI